MSDNYFQNILEPKPKYNASRRRRKRSSKWEDDTIAYTKREGRNLDGKY